MVSVDEAAETQAHQLQAALKAGIDSLSQDQTVVFTKYVKLVLPLDGYVFWVRADLVSHGAQFNASALNAVTFNQAGKVLTSAPTIAAKGSLHHATDIRQDEVETYSVNSVVFTSEVEIRDLNDVGPGSIYIATLNGIRFAFSQRNSFYAQAGIYHYRGQAVYADMATQLIDSLTGFDSRNVIVSNSLPLWLGLNGYAPIYPTFGNPILVMYPSFLLPANLTPPFASVHIPPESTTALQSAPWLDADSSHYQLVRETVKITMWGMRNFDALDFVDCVNQYSLDYDLFGIMNMPTIRDEKREQRELVAIAQKKSITYEINYYQTRMNDIARQLILSAIPTFIFA